MWGEVSPSTIEIAERAFLAEVMAGADALRLDLLVLLVVTLLW